MYSFQHVSLQVLDIPLTVKMRTGIYDKNWNAHKLLPKLHEWGVTMTTVSRNVICYFVHSPTNRSMEDPENNGTQNLRIMIILLNVQMQQLPCLYLVI